MQIAMDDERCPSKTVGVILAAGKGTRMCPGREPKQFLNLEGKPILLHSIEVFDACLSIDEVVVVVPSGMTARTKSILRKRDFRCPIVIMVGGEKRQDSCFKAMQRLSRRGDVGFVAIHDAARPLITAEIVAESVREAKKYGASAVATRTTDTVLNTRDGFVVSIPNRGRLFNAQTPQVFRFDLIWEAHKAARREGLRDVTDDVQLVLRLGHKVKLVEAPPENMKITTKRDLDMASLIIKEKLRRTL